MLIGGIITVISLIPLCWGVGIYMIGVGLIVGLLEAPIIFEKIECTKSLATRFKNVKPATRAILYIGLAIFIFFCFGIASYIAAILLIACGFAYGLVWLGPRGGAIKKQQGAGGPGAAEAGEGADGSAEDKEKLIDEHRDVTMEEAKPSWAQSISDGVGAAVGKAVAAQVKGSLTGTKPPADSHA